MQIERNNLSLSLPFGRPAIIALVMLALALVLVEVVARTPFSRNRFPELSIGTSHRLFEIHLSRLDDLVAQEGARDCIILGSSQAYRGYDVEQFQAGYKAITGDDIACYNFGLGGLTPMTAGIVGPIIAERYQPNLLIYSTEPFAYDVDSEGNDAHAALSENVWIEHKQGEFNIDGWLRDHSVAYRTYLIYRNWMKFTFAITQERNALASAETTKLGHGPVDEVLVDFEAPSEEERPNAWRVMRKFDPSERHYAGAEAILELNSAETQVLVFETVFIPTILDIIADPAEYDVAFNNLETLAGDYGVSVVRTFGQHTIVPDDGWFDHNHLNRVGSVPYSDWAGREVGLRVLDGTLAEVNR